MSISYEGIGAWCATFAAGTGAEEGKVVKVSANGTVSKCAANDGFCGVVAAMGRDGKACSVQLGGLVRVPYKVTKIKRCKFAKNSCKLALCQLFLLFERIMLIFFPPHNA